MDIVKTKIQDLFIIDNEMFFDERGLFIKTFNDKYFGEFNLKFIIKESYFSISAKNVIRGMHFQIPPHEHEKLVYVPNGSIIDVVLDIRKNSPSYGEYIYVELSNKNHKSIFIPAGCAHGFLSLERNTNVTYLQSSVYDSEFDKGIRWDSFGMQWKVKEPIVSERDKSFLKFIDFKTPFL